MTAIPSTVPVAYLIRKRGNKNRAHLWLGADTVCRMYSTGVLRQKAYSVHDSDCGRLICLMCRNLLERAPRPLDKLDRLQARVSAASPPQAPEPEPAENAEAAQ
jgi:hypothetical protein